MNSEPVLQAKEANPAVNTRRVSSSTSHSPLWFITLTTLEEASEPAVLCLMLPKYCKTFDSP